MVARSQHGRGLRNDNALASTARSMALGTPFAIMPRRRRPPFSSGISFNRKPSSISAPVARLYHRKYACRPLRRDTHCEPAFTADALAWRFRPPTGPGVCCRLAGPSPHRFSARAVSPAPAIFRAVLAPITTPYRDLSTRPRLIAPSAEAQGPSTSDRVSQRPKARLPRKSTSCTCPRLRRRGHPVLVVF